MSQNSLKTFSQKVSELPLWVKQIIYLELKEELELFLTKNTLDLINKENCLQLYIPKLTFIGRKEIETKSKNFPDNIYDFLNFTSQGFNIIEIAVKNNWTLVETSSYFISAINSELLADPDSSCIKGTALYLSGHIRIGEYFIKLGKITIEQLDEALRIQRYLEESTDDGMGLGEVLVNFGFVTKSDVDGILLLKEESKKRYIPDVLNNLDSSFENQDIKKLSEQVSLLTRENNQLKDQLRDFLNIGKKY